MKEVLVYLWGRRTTVLGYIQVVLGVWIVAENVFTADTVRLFVLINGTIMAVLGHYNNAMIRNAEHAEAVAVAKEEKQ